MADFDHIQNMHDISLKPRLLRALLSTHVPDAKRQFRSPSDLSHVVSMVKTHSLLSESITAEESANKKQIENWNSAIDAWVKRLLTLTSSKSPDKCWAGICLLGVTCQECCSERFLASYADWFNKLLVHIQPAGDSHFVKVASCASISDLLVRLDGFANVKKDGSSIAGKLIQPVLKILNESSSDAVWEGAIHLLCTIITYFPSSMRQHYFNVEASIGSKIISGNCSVGISKKLGQCLALLPKSRGDEDSWSLIMQKVLLSIDVHLSDALQGLEDETKSKEIRKILEPPGKDPPLALGTQATLGGNSVPATKAPERLHISTVSTLMLCCCKMLTSHYPVQVTVPVRPLLLLVGRVLMVDGSLPQFLFPISLQQEFICSELPGLHFDSLELLGAIIKGIRSQLLPHAADIVRLLTEYFKRCALPELRVKVYSIIRVLLMSMGVGITLVLTQVLINNAFIDLESICKESVGTSLNVHSKLSDDALMQPVQKKRKHKSNGTVLEEHPDRGNVEIESHKRPTPISVKIAALEAIEALLTVGGAFRSESWRSKVDHLLIGVASDVCKEAWSFEGKSISLSSECADFQLAALRALLASLISPARVRPPHLARGLELFHRGTLRETGTKVGEFCKQALMSVEVLIHPRALPLMDFSSSSGDIINNSFDKTNNVTRFPGGVMYSCSNQKQQNISSSPFDAPGKKRLYEAADSDDELYKSWVETGKEGDETEQEQPSETTTARVPSSVVAIDNADENNRDDEIMAEVQEAVIITKSQEPFSQDGGPAPVVAAVVDVAMEGAVLDSSETAPEKDDKTLSVMFDRGAKEKGILDNDSSSSDSFPQIVDDDSDSDSVSD